MTVTRAARALRPGEVVLFKIATPTPASHVSVHAFGREWPAFQGDPRHWRALVGIDLETKPGTYTAVIAADAERTSSSLAVQSRVFPTRRLTVDPDLVNPPPEAMERI